MPHLDLAAEKREPSPAKLVETAKAQGIELKQTYAKEGQLLGYKAGRYGPMQGAGFLSSECSINANSDCSKLVHARKGLAINGSANKALTQQVCQLMVTNPPRAGFLLAGAGFAMLATQYRTRY